MVCALFSFKDEIIAKPLLTASLVYTLQDKTILEIPGRKCDLRREHFLKAISFGLDPVITSHVNGSLEVNI